MKLLVTGGAGFIGSAVVRQAVKRGMAVVNLDKLTYAGCLGNVAEVSDNPLYAFEHADICDRLAVERILKTHQPDLVMHLAAESHVDRSIDGPAAFIQTNITGTYTLLEAARAYWTAKGKPAQFRFTTSRPTKCSDRLAHPANSPKIPPMTPDPLILPPRRHPTIWSAPGMKPSACRWF